MKLSKSKAMIAAVCIAGMGHAAVAKTVSNTTRYKNERGSILRLTWHAKGNDTGTVTGSFRTAVGDCKAEINKAVPVTGHYSGNAMALTINFPKCKQVIAMTGNVDATKTKIATLWLDAHATTDPQKDWNSNIIGTDTFHKIAMTTPKKHTKAKS